MGLTIRRHVSKPTERSRIVCVQTPPPLTSVESGEGVDATSPIFTEGRGSVHRLGREMSAVFSRWNEKVDLGRC